MSVPSPWSKEQKLHFDRLNSAHNGFVSGAGAQAFYNSGRKPQPFSSNPYYQQALQEQIGFDPTAYGTLQDQLTAMSVQQTQGALSNQARRQNMMGTSAVGADVTANNALISQMGGQLLGQHAQLGQANMQQMEQDLTEKGQLAQMGYVTDLQGQKEMAAQMAGLQQVGSEMLANVQSIKGALDPLELALFQGMMTQAETQIGNGDTAGAYMTITTAAGSLGMSPDEAESMLVEAGLLQGRHSQPGSPTAYWTNQGPVG